MEIIDDQCRDWKKTQLTGYFRDGLRRIDLIMVTKDNPVEEVEHIKMDFLINTMNAGFELEIETGMRDIHRHLCFIKVHAPDHILKHFGYYYSIRKYFKESHLRYVNAAVRDETNLIKVVRKCSQGPLNYSTMERSLITYKILQAMTFGEPKNFIGIQRLLDHNILLDVYPLHDGPYFLTKFQKPAEFHGRQALFYNWVGYRNLLRWQPIHLIREYLGERMAFLFAFFEYCNITLAIAGVFGILTFIIGFVTSKARIKKIVNKYNNKANTHDFPDGAAKVNYKDLPVCPKCKDFVGCPFRYMEEYTKENNFKLLLDFPYNIAYAYFVVMAVLMLYVLWRRREYYLSWLWEVDEHYEKRMPRPEHIYEPPVPGRVMHAVKNKQLYAYFRRIHLTSIIKKLNEFGFLLLILIAYFLTYLPALLSVTLTGLNRIRYVEEEMKAKKIKYDQSTFNYIIVALVGCVNGSCILLMEKLWVIVAKRLTDSLNPRTHKAYEKYHIFKMFGMTVVINFGLVFFYAFFKGAFYTHPGDTERWQMPLSLGMLNCGMLPCIDEVFIIFISTFVSKKIYDEFILLLQRWYYKTDVYPLDDGYVDIPSWEREYELFPINQHFVMDRFNEIFINMCIGTFFASIVPLSAIVVFLWQVWNIRHWAKYLIIHGRRPLIQQNWGLSAWKYVLLFLPFAAAFVNSYTWVRQTIHFDQRFEEIYFSSKFKLRRFYADYYMGFFNVSDYDYSNHTGSGSPGKKIRDYNWTFGVKERPTHPYVTYPHFCMFPGQYKRKIPENAKGAARVPIPNSYTPEAGKWYINWRQAMFMLCFELMTFFSALFLVHHIEPQSDTVVVTKEMEDTLKQFHIGREPARDTDYVQPENKKPKEQ